MTVQAIAPRSTARRVARALAAAAALLLVGYHLGFALLEPVNFDEGYNLQIPLNLVANGRYQSWYHEAHPFPPQITTGPTVLLPIALLFAGAGPSIVVARAVMTLFLLVLLWQLWLLCRRVAGTASDWVFAAACLLFALTPLALWVSSAILGEVPAVACFLAGVNLTARAIETRQPAWAFAGGVLFGLAILSKIVLLLCVVAVGPALLLCSELRARRVVALRLALGGLFGLGLALGAWEAVKLGVLGWPGYLANWERFTVVLDVGGSGIDRTGALRDGPTAAMHVRMLADKLDEPVATVWLGLWLGAAGVALALALSARRFVLLALALAVACYWAWWLQFSTWNYLRHLLPGYVLFALLVPLLASAAFARLRTPVSRALLLAVLATAATLLLPPWRPLTRPGSRRGVAFDQHLAASWVTRIAAADPRSVFWAFGWSQAPEISFLATRPFRDVTRAAPSPDRPNYFVAGGLTRANRDHLEYANRHCVEVIVKGGDVVLCRLGDGAPQGSDRSFHP